MKKIIFSFLAACTFATGFAEEPPVKVGEGYKAFRYVVDSKGRDSLVYQAPLVIVDGKEQHSEILNYIKPEDIQSMNILKKDNDYGEKGKNGVILIVTKTGYGKHIKYPEGK